MESIAYYKPQSALTDPGEFADVLSSLPSSIPQIAETVQGLLLDYEERYKHPVVNERLLDTNLRSAKQILTRLSKLGKSPLTEARPPHDRMLATTSHFVTLFVSIARAKGYAARKRTGFVPYCKDIYAGYYKARDIAEYYDETANKWVAVDPMLDKTAIALNGIDFDPYNLPADKFIPAAKAWADSRAGKTDPKLYRNQDVKGYEVLAAALLCDLAGLNKIELLNWDRYGYSLPDFDKLFPSQLASLDVLAETLGSLDVTAIKNAYAAEIGFQVPSVVVCRSTVVPHHRAEIAC